jgi:hypothetical protein
LTTSKNLGNSRAIPKLAFGAGWCNPKLTFEDGQTIHPCHKPLQVFNHPFQQVIKVGVSVKLWFGQSSGNAYDSPRLCPSWVASHELVLLWSCPDKIVIIDLPLQLTFLLSKKMKGMFTLSLTYWLRSSWDPIPPPFFFSFPFLKALFFYLLFFFVCFYVVLFNTSLKKLVTCHELKCHQLVTF